MKNRLLFLLPVLLFAIKGKSQDYNYTLSHDSLVNKHASIKRIYYATRTGIKPKIDGILDDECWKTVGIWDGGFIQQQPHQAKPPSQETEIKILYDDKYLYFAIIAHDNEPEKMSPLLGRRDDYTVGDIAGIALDSYHDKQTAFEFNLTSAGQKVDLMHLGEYGWDFNWDAVWDGKTSLGDSAWYAEMRVPFTQIRFANTKEHIWGMHIWRWIYRLSEETQWKLIPVDAPAMVYIFGELRGISEIPYKRNFEVMPYAKAKYFTETEDNRNFGFGVDGKIGVSSNFTLDYTINPDFGQVEADPSELNLTSYEIFYDEKRPFFLEGKNILEYNAGNDMMFYSRRIGHAPSYRPQLDEAETLSVSDNTSILNALKLTGKNKKGFSLGLVNSMTARENATIYSGENSSKEAVEPFTNYFIGRLKQDLNNGSTTFGGMLTSTLRDIKDANLEFLPEKSTVAGMDAEHNWLNRKYFVNGKAFYSKMTGSETAIARLQRSAVHLYQRPDAGHLDYDETKTSLEGWGGQVSGGKRSGKLRVSGTVDWRSPGVDLNDLGYLKQADFIVEDFHLMYMVNQPRGILLSYSGTLDQRHHWSFGGESLKDELDSHMRLRFKNYYTLDLDLDRTYNEIDTRELRGGPSLRKDNNTSAQFFLQTNSTKKLFLGGGMDYTWFDNRLSNIVDYDFYIQWNILNNLSVSSRTGFAAETDNNQYVTKKAYNGNTEYVIGNINRKTMYTTIRAEYFITPELSLQYYGSPYASTGEFRDFRFVNNSISEDISKRYTSLSVFQNSNGEKFIMKGSDVIQDLNSWNPDFNFQEFNSNFVLRWEYKTGSTMYFVWTNNRSGYEEKFNPSILNSFKNIANVKSRNAFMLKVSYWFSI